LLLSVRKFNNVRDPFELPDFWQQTALTSIYLITKSDSESTRKKAQDVNDFKWYLVDV